MIKVLRHPVFVDWLHSLRDDAAKASIAMRVDRLALGNPGHARSVGGGIFEMKIDKGPGYRIYCTRRGERLVVLLCGGDKSSQAKDIQRAIDLAKRLEE